MRRFCTLAMALALSIAVGNSSVWGADEVSESKADRNPGGAPMNPMVKRLTDEKYDELHGRIGNGPGVGEVAPDFALTPLKFYEFKISERDITKENAGELYRPVKLSDFRGKRPVVLIFGSYT